VTSGVYRIGTVAEMVGVPRNTLLAWERRYGLLDPDRTVGGYRAYTDDDVAKLRRIKGLVDRGYKISEAVALAGRSGPEGHAPPRWADDALLALRAEMLDRLIAFDRAGAEAVRRRLHLFSFQQGIEAVYLPLLREVGEGWHAGTVTVAQEHFASAFCREQFTSMLHKLEGGPESGPLAVCAGVPGELHELGLLAVAVQLALRGWRISYLGADLPPEDLAAAVHTQKASLVCQSVVLRQHGSALVAYARRLRALLDPGVRLVIGGAGAVDLVGAVPGVEVAHHVDAVLSD